MLPHTVLHKRNGHRQLPRPGIVSTGQLVSLVHSAPGRPSPLSPDLLKFAVMMQSESLLPDQLDQDVFSSAVVRALARTREAFDRGELTDLRSALEALQAQADLAAGLIARLTETVPAHTCSQPRRRGRRSPGAASMMAFTRTRLRQRRLRGT